MHFLGMEECCKGISTVELGAKWRVDNRKTLNFWTDWWVGNKLLIIMESEIDILDNQLEKRVSDFVSPERTWSLNNLEVYLLDEVLENIREVSLAYTIFKMRSCETGLT